MKIVVAGEGAFGRQHLRALAAIPGVEVVGLAGGDAAATAARAAEFGIPHWSLSIETMLGLPGVEAAILATPTPMHAAQAIECLRAGKHVQVEIPMADSLANARSLTEVVAETGLVAMAGHTRRFNPSHQWIHGRLRAGTLKLHQMDVQTHFLRRDNLNALGEPRTWTDHLLWHHACHTVDLFQHQTGEVASIARAIQGPIDARLGIAMDMAIQMKAPSGAICGLSLSFNNDGPLGSVFRYICDDGAYVARYDDLWDGHGAPVDLSSLGEPTNGVERQDREFVSAIREGREPNASVRQVLPAYETLDRIEKSLA